MVEWKEMWQVTTWDKKFSGVDKTMQPKVIKYHYYLANELTELERQNGDIRILYTTDKIAFADSADVNENISEGEVVAIPWGGNVTIKYYNGRFVTADNRIATSNNTDYLNNKYLYYWMLSQKDVVASFYRGAGIQHPSMYKILTMPIPIPSLSEQTRIVGILDTFTAAIDNIKEQIALRRKQYEHYRDQLLDLEGKEGVEMKTLGEVCEKTKNIRWKAEPADKTYFYIDLSSVSIDLNQITDVTEICKDIAPSRAQQIVKTGDILLGTTRPTLKRYCNVPKQYDSQICSTGYCVFRAKSNMVLNKWIFHNIGIRNFWDYCEAHQQGAGYPCLSNSDAFAYVIPVPPLEEQQRIVSILDTFEESIYNLEVQLEQREKQYEYYRNKLLKFE